MAPMGRALALALLSGAAVVAACGSDSGDEPATGTGTQGGGAAGGAAGGGAGTTAGAGGSGQGGNGGSPAGGSGGSPWCTDEPPDDSYTCGEQVGWGKCDEAWMAGYCDRSCGRCEGIGAPTDPCVDESPPGDVYTCAEQAGWGKCSEPWMQGYCLVSCRTCPIEPQLIDPQASSQTSTLLSYLISTYRTHILAGQQSREDADYLAGLTGKHPAIVGLDLMDYSPSRVEHGATSDVVEQAIAWSQQMGGILTLSWHWNAPAELVDSETWPWWKGFYAEATTFDFATAMYDLQSQEHELILRDIDAIAVELQRLEDAQVPVLWRPIHEASGGWFWWGDWGPEPYLALWRLLYDRLVNYHGLHHLIWVWNGQAPEWYPGDVYVDIVSEDIYDAALDYDPQQQAYLDALSYAGMPKLVALSETGVLLDPGRLLASEARWSWFMLWSGEFANTELWNEDAMKLEVYASELVVTLDELPDLAE